MCVSQNPCYGNFDMLGSFERVNLEQTSSGRVVRYRFNKFLPKFEIIPTESLGGMDFLLKMLSARRFDNVSEKDDKIFIIQFRLNL